MNRNTLSEEEKQRRIQKARSTKAWYRYWETMWQYIAIRDEVPPLKIAATSWKTISTKQNESNLCAPEFRKLFIRWLRKNHDIRMDSEDIMHPILRKKK